jgi:hypothetical protein
LDYLAAELGVPPLSPVAISMEISASISIEIARGGL